MADAGLVVSHFSASKAPPVPLGNVFKNVSFFLVQRLPSRSRYVSEIEANGGRVVKLESRADYVIADHLRSDAPGGSYSYTLIEAALRQGSLPADMAKYAAGPETGSVSPSIQMRPVKSTRTPFSAEDDMFLWRWVQREKADGAAEKGNDMYKRLEASNPRHTFHAWRDRYLKKLLDNPPAAITAMVGANAPPSPPADGPADPPSFTEEDYNTLMKEAPTIEEIDPEQYEDAWLAWAECCMTEYSETHTPQEVADYNKSHSAHDWKTFYKLTVRPDFIERQKSAGDPAAPSNKRKRVPRGKVTSNKRRATSPQVILASAGATPDASQADSEQLNPTADAKDPSEVEMPTSDANQEAEQQLHHEDSQPSSEAEVDGTVAERADMPTTLDADHVADLQLREELGQHEQSTPVHHIRKAGEGSASSDQQILRWSHADPSSDQKLPRWSHAEDKILLDRLRRNWTARRIIRELPNPDLRTQSAIRGRKAVLMTKYGGKSPVKPVCNLGRKVMTRAGGAPAGDGSDAHRAGAMFDKHTPNAPGDALTEANLANQQAQHQKGIDISADDGTQHQIDFINYLDETQDQIDFITYLQETVGRTTRVDYEDDEMEDEFFEMVRVNDHDDYLLAEAQLRMMSQQELNDMLESNLLWPSSPKRKSQQRTTVHNDAQSTRTSGSGQVFEPLDKFSTPSLLSQLQNQADTGEEDATAASTQLAGEPYSKLDEDNQDFPPDTYPDDIDLTVPEPPGGFQSSCSPPPERESLQVPNTDSPHVPSTSAKETLTADNDEIPSGSPLSSLCQSSEDGVQGSDLHAVGTQDILNAETQLPDLNIPLPPESVDVSEVEPSAPPDNQHRAEQVETLDTWVASMKNRGFKHSVVINALKRTCNRPDLAKYILFAERLGKDLPDNVPGIWSMQEDEMLESGDANRLSSLEDKHGWEQCKARMNWLSEWRAGA